jgi:hypothetical protein
VTALGLWLLAVGVCDLLRAAHDDTSGRRRAALVALGVALLAFTGVAARFGTTEWPGIGAVWVLGLVLWLVASSFALDPTSQRRGTWRAVAFTSFGVAATLLVLLGGAAVTPMSLPDGLAGSVLADVGPDRVCVVAGVALFELSTANLLVRLLLDAIGVPAVTNEKRLRGGRLLGPMERLFIVVLGLAGDLTAAAVVVAAKGLLRFPELQRTSKEDGPTEVSEYFLIGSFSSWLLAVAGLLVLRWS